MSIIDNPICRRSLEYISGSGKTDVTIQIWQPVPDLQHPEDFCCRFEVTGLPEEIAGNAVGVDTMQALACALQGVRMKLQSFAGQLVFLGSPYEEFGEIVIGSIDPGRRRRIFQILEEEQYSLEVLFGRDGDKESVRALRAQHRCGSK
jgi:hypothetical protein